MTEQTECEIKGHDYNPDKTFCFRCKSRFKKLKMTLTSKPTEIDDLKKFTYDSIDDYFHWR